MASSCLKDAFEAFWRRRYGVDGVLTPSTAPHLDCFDPRGQATAQAVECSLAQCRDRMAALRQKVRDEEYLEEFLSGVLRDGQALLVGPTNGSTKSENGVTEKGKSLVSSHSISDVREDKSPRNPRITIAERRHKFEVLAKLQDSDSGNSVKKTPKTFPKKPTPPKTDHTTGKESTEEKPETDRTTGKEFTEEKPETDRSTGKESTEETPDLMATSGQFSAADDENSKQNNGAIEEKVENEPDSKDHKSTDDRSEENTAKHPASDATESSSGQESNSAALDAVSITSVGSIRRKNPLTSVSSLNVENASEDDVSDDDAANLMALRQSVTYANRWCEGVDSTRSRLEEQAQRLSKRFTQLHYGKGLDTGRSQELGVVDEAPASPSLGQLEQSGGNDADWVPTPTLFVSVMDLGGGNPDESLGDRGGGGKGGGQHLPERGEMRGWVVTSLLDSERSYMEILDSLMDYKQMFKNFAGKPNMVVTLSDVEVIFHRVSDLHKIHYQFVRDLEPKVANWSPEQQIADIFKVLALEEYSIAPDYLRNYSKALSTIHACRQASPQFDQLTKDISFKRTAGMEKTTLEDMLHKPIVRFQRNTLLLHDLIKYTPTCHPDYDLLQKTLKFARRFLDNLETTESRDNSENQRYLARHGLIVEKVNKTRKLRHIFLFNDLIVSAKQKTSNRTKIQYEVKWFIPLTDLSLEDKIGLREDVILEQDQKEEVAQLQKKISELQAEHKAEMKKAKQAAENAKIKMRKPVTNKNIERIRKKLMEQEAALVISSPSLVFRLYNPKAQKQYVIMMSSDYERTDWKDSITGLLFKAPAPVHLTATDVQNLVNKQKLANLKPVGGVGSERDSVFMEEERLFGSLHVRICRLQGLKQATSSVCHIEVDSFGHFTLKAKTNSSPESIDPVWNQDFEIDLDGSQTLRILCYHQLKGVTQLLGKGALELRSIWLKDGAEEDCVISINNEMSVTISMQYTSREKAIPRCFSTLVDGLFGIRLDIITARERVAIPVLVTSCAEEIERRGFDEEGIYRVSGLFETVQQLKDAFEKNSMQAVSLIKTVDVNSLTGLMKLFFRKLPESLFTDALYKNFQEGIGLADPDARDRCLVSLFATLPEPNFSTALFLLDHLIRVSKYEEKNKMTLKNLATVFGPTLLRPATRHSQAQTMEQLFFLSAHEAMLQTTILLHFMNLRSNGVEFKRNA